MSGALTLKTRVIKDGIRALAMKNPIFLPGPVEPNYRKYLTFQGISVDEEGKQHYLDASLSFKQACHNAINYLKLHGLTGEQAYMLLSAAPCEGRINSIVDHPNACCTMAVPAEIFEADILPKI
jgi:formamidase